MISIAPSNGADGDEWSEWLLHRRHADDPDCEQIVRAVVERLANCVLDGARLAPGMTVADIGAGEGLVAFGAIDRIGPSLSVIFTDISVPMLRHAERLSVERGVREQCSFLQCSAESLENIPDESVDVVTTRAVLAYVSDKPAALREFHRILKPGGRLSIGEPIFQDDALEAVALRKMIEAPSSESQNHFLHLLHRWKAAQFPDTDERMAQSPIANYSERDLVRYVCGSGFVEIHLAFHIDIAPSLIKSWDVFLGSSPHPWAPSVSAILANQFTPEERQLFEQALRPTIEGRQCITTERMAYLTAKKPLQPV
jgi:arsenite methyltransferase